MLPASAVLLVAAVALAVFGLSHGTSQALGYFVGALACALGSSLLLVLGVRLERARAGAATEPH